MSFGRAGDGLHLTDRQALALEFEAVIDEVTVAEVRRRAISELADRLLADPAIGGCVREVMRFRAREIGVGAAGLRLVEGAGDNG